MLLLIDIGNTSTTLGFCRNGAIKDTLRIESAAGGLNIEMFPELLHEAVRDRQLEKPDSAAICSVVPAVTPLLAGALEKDFGISPLHVSSGIKTGLNFSIKDSAALGADRIANAAAARKLYKGHLVVVDFGTATTFCVITEKGDYIGGAIMPGPGLSVHALSSKTAKLPSVELTLLHRIIGKDTTENILSGIIMGHAGAVERIVREMGKEINLALTLIVTGGYADLVVPYIKGIEHVNPLLTLEGLRFIYEMNRQ